ncbi:MAG TPA: metallophosphoesterase [Pyrinomonadaceae bacterium]|nr:metallophosphoesterase [Pyrinomonadaceae bacterium]
MAKPKLSRRDFLTGLAAAPLVAVSATTAYARLIEPYSYEISHTDIFIRDLPERFEGFRITQITDVHHSRILSLAEVHSMVQRAQQTQPDLIALTGDYTTAYRRYIEPCAEALGRLHAPEGVWAVLGNHDHYTDRELTTRALRRTQIEVMNNSNTMIRRGPDVLQLVGIDDWSWAGTDWQRAMAGIDSIRPSILLSHQPMVLDMQQTRDVSLILSGHTHGGQIQLPGIGAPAHWFMKDLKYNEGLFRRGETQLYVSRGTGVIGLPLRFGSRPEIAVLHLRHAVTETARG